MSRHWERTKPGVYQLVYLGSRDWRGNREESYSAEIARGADGNWWMYYLDKKEGWTCIRCRTLGNAKAVAEERGKT